MSESEVHALFDRLFLRGFAGQDGLDEIAPEGWERSPLLACFYPSIERIFEERSLMRRNVEELCRMRRRRDGATVAESSPEPTLEDVREGYAPRRTSPGMEQISRGRGLTLALEEPWQP
jgi:hypothetical protein